MVFEFLFLTSLSVLISTCIHFTANGIMQYFLGKSTKPLRDY